MHFLRKRVRVLISFRGVVESQKPWLHKKDKWERLSWWTTFLIMWLGVAAGAVVCYLGFT